MYKCVEGIFTTLITIWKNVEMINVPDLSRGEDGRNLHPEAPIPPTGSCDTETLVSKATPLN